MQIRVVQIWGFLMTVLGWVFMACTMAMENWMNTSIGGLAGSYVMKQVSYYANLWHSCFIDSTAVSHCYDFPVLWAVDVDIQIVRGLLIAALCLGMLGFVLSLMGMECTFIGGKDRSKHKIIFAGGWCHIISGLIATCGYAVFMQYVLTYFNPDPDGLDYNLGSPVPLGWVGAAIHMTGGFFYLWSVWIQLCRREDKVIKIQPLSDPEQNQSTVSEIPSATKVASAPEPPISSRSEDTTKSAHTSRSRGKTPTSARSESGSESTRLSISSMSTLSKSRSSSVSRTASSASGSSRNETSPFMKTSYI